MTREAALHTSSWFRKWWLTSFRGYRTVTAVRSPQWFVFGRVRYKNTWFLVLRSEKPRA